LVATQQQQSAQINQLIELQRRQADDIQALKTDVSQIKTDVSQIKTDVSGLKTDVSGLKTDVSSLKGKVYEQEYRAKASGIFGRFIRRGRDRTDDIAERLHDAVAVGQIPETERIQVLAADLIWGGKSYLDATDIIVVLEASWRAEVNDVERPHRRADILRRLGFQAVAVVAGTEWDDQALSVAQALGVAVASNGQVNADSWHAALAIT